MPVIAAFHALRDRVLKGNDGLFGERVQLAFFDKDGEADTERQSLEITAPLRTGAGENSNLDGGFARSWRARIAAQKAELHIDPATYTGPQLRKGDKVRALARDGQPWFEVLSVDDRNHTRLVVRLGEQ